MSEEIKSGEVVEDVNEQPTIEEPETKPEEKTVTMTQAELNALIGKEKGRVKSKYADYDDIKAKASEYEKALEEKRLAELSEKERAEELARKFEEEKNQLSQQLEELRIANEKEKIRNEFIKAATSQNIEYIDDALRLADLSGVSVEEGKVVGIEDVVAKLVENKPFLLAQQKKVQKPIGESSNGITNNEVKTLEAQLEDAKAAKNFSKVIELSNKIKGLIK